MTSLLAVVWLLPFLLHHFGTGCEWPISASWTSFLSLIHALVPTSHMYLLSITPLSLSPMREWSPGACFLNLLFFYFTYSPDPTFCYWWLPNLYFQPSSSCWAQQSLPITSSISYTYFPLNKLQPSSLILSFLLPFQTCSFYSICFPLSIVAAWCQCLYIIPFAPLTF